MTTSHKIDGIETPELQVSASTFGVVARVSLAGTADTRSKGSLDVLLKRLHARCVVSGVREVAVDLRALEFMDSSCFKTFVTWVSAVRELAPTAQYRINLISNAQRHWQRRSLGALACFAVELISIQT